MWKMSASSSRQHKRCGTSFLFLVLAISIILLLLIHVDSMGMRVVVRLLLLPVIAGISYEILHLAGDSDGCTYQSCEQTGTCDPEADNERTG